MKKKGNWKKALGAVISLLSLQLLAVCFATGIFATTANENHDGMAITEDTADTDETAEAVSENADETFIPVQDVSYIEVAQDGTKYAVSEEAAEPVAIKYASEDVYLLDNGSNSGGDSNVLSASGDAEMQTDDWDDDDQLGTAAYIPQ